MSSDSVTWSSMVKLGPAERQHSTKNPEIKSINLGVRIRQIKNGWLLTFDEHDHDLGLGYEEATYCANLEDINREVTAKLGKLKINS